eukprot:3794646-Rhodomonas_salina.1
MGVLQYYSTTVGGRDLAVDWRASQSRCESRSLIACVSSRNNVSTASEYGGPTIRAPTWFTTVMVMVWRGFEWKD